MKLVHEVWDAVKWFMNALYVCAVRPDLIYNPIAGRDFEQSNLMLIRFWGFISVSILSVWYLVEDLGPDFSSLPYAKQLIYFDSIPFVGNFFISVFVAIFICVIGFYLAVSDLVFCIILRLRGFDPGTFLFFGLCVTAGLIALGIIIYFSFSILLGLAWPLHAYGLIGDPLPLLTEYVPAIIFLVLAIFWVIALVRVKSMMSKSVLWSIVGTMPTMFLILFVFTIAFDTSAM